MMAEVCENEGGATVLVIDDDELVLRTFRRILESAGYRVTAVEGGAAALDVLQRGETFDVILCDLSMPEVDGVDVFDFVRQNRPALVSRLVFSTGGAYTDRVRSFVSRAPAPTVEKPVTPSELREAIEQVIERTRAR